MNNCLIGLPDSGKSTALAALFYLVTDHSELCDWFLDNADRPSNSDYWYRLRDLWVQGKSLKRTKHEAIPAIMKLKLTHKENNTKTTINIPDIPGEDYQGLYSAGRFPLKAANLIDKADRLIFFLRVDDEDVPVLSISPEALEKDQSSNPAGGDVKLSEAPPVEWEAIHMPIQSKVIAMLRCIRMLKKIPLTKLTIVLTAWDSVVEDGVTPDSVIKTCFPLVAQYLETNFDYDLYGLSAQGYDYGDTEGGAIEKEKAQVFEDAIANGKIDLGDVNRINVITRDGNEHCDMTKIFT